jgi:hypothetical protein
MIKYFIFIVILSTSSCSSYKENNKKNKIVDGDRYVGKCFRYKKNKYIKALSFIHVIKYSNGLFTIRRFKEPLNELFFFEDIPLRTGAKIIFNYNGTSLIRYHDLLGLHSQVYCADYLNYVK